MLALAALFSAMIRGIGVIKRNNSQQMISSTCATTSTTLKAYASDLNKDHNNDAQRGGSRDGCYAQTHQH